ncbi:hypothetical protein [Streptomyces sp. RKAG293]|uniref:hypothetical protein n=1 Tax=Streptomyces sp. RKAG293 TaxID=2893403 RepID=UPI002034237A|nr:hypothetical protein [Streptomyces sp. RKAG293]MCM2424257.1 hypothetical protein [Streptomyces sp. RKAG293]
MNNRRRSRQRARAIALGVSPEEPAPRAPVVVPLPHPPLAPPEPAEPPAPTAERSCCRATRTRRVSIGGTVVITHTHQAHCPDWGHAS